MNFTKEELTAITSGDVDLLNSKLTDMHHMIVESTLRSIPAMVSSLVRFSVGMSEITQKFYEDNPTYAKHKGIVAAVIEEADRSNPGKNIEEILKIAGPEIAKRVSVAESMVSASTDVNKTTRDSVNASFNGVL